MKLDKFLLTREGLLSENRFSRLLLLAMAGVLVAVSFVAVSKEQVVTIQPYTLSDEAWVSKSDASQSYKEAWGLLLATLTGNVTPASLRFVRERLEPLLSPQIYQQVMEAIEVQALYIRNDRISMRFEPREVVYEPNSNIVFVTGDSFLTSASGETIRDRRTYEYRIDIRNYQPVVSYIDTYTGRPRLN